MSWYMHIMWTFNALCTFVGGWIIGKWLRNKWNARSNKR
jgi:hypothetical protein